MDLSTKEIELVVKVNLLGALLCTQASAGGGWEEEGGEGGG